MNKKGKYVKVRTLILIGTFSNTFTLSDVFFSIGGGTKETLSLQMASLNTHTRSLP